MAGYGLIKTSIVLFYRRIFVTSKRTLFDMLTKITIIVIFLWTIAFILMIIFACGSEFSANWGSPAAQHVYCNKIGFTSEEGLAGSDLILDVVLLILPIPVIWRLQMSNTRKVAVTAIFMLGLSALAASVARLVLYVQVIQAAVDDVEVDQNPCLPTLSYLFTRFSFRSVLYSARSAIALLPHRSNQKSSQSAPNLPNQYFEIDRQASSSFDVRCVPRPEKVARSEYTLQDLKPSVSV
ncbi:MAG: hypothetical protein Q9213_007969 [Squamulea squamosa]